jgi:hypothetical protein
MRTFLEETRQKLGQAPRSFSIAERFYLHVRPAPWMHASNDRLLDIYRHRKALLQRGQVVWGHLIQANAQLFRPGANDCPAAAVYSRDPFFDDQLATLSRIANALYDLKGTQPDDPTLARFAHTITDERERIMKLAVPHKLTGGRDVFYTVIMVHRKHLPDGYLTDSVFPLLIHPPDIEATLIVPSRYWSPGLVGRWQRNAAG